MKINNSLKEIAKSLKKAKSIAIFTHINPDFDALGSSYGMYYGLKKMGKSVELFSKSSLTTRQKLLFDDLINKKECNKENFDLFICLDASALNRLGEYSYVFENINNNTMIIDHHICNNKIAKYNYIKSDSSSCCEIVFEILTALKVKIDDKIATFLYAGLSSDTFSFQNSNTNINSHKVATKLIEYGADIHGAVNILYEMRTKKEILLKKYLWNNFKMYKDCAYVLVDKNTLKELKGKKADCDSFSKSLVAIEGVNRSFSLIEEQDDVIYLSMRAKKGYDVRVIAEKFGGGGHICAAGAKIESCNINDMKKKLLKAIFEGENNEN